MKPKIILATDVLSVQQIIGDDVENTTGTVLSVSQVTGLVSVKLDSEEKGQYSPRYSDSVEVPKTRVQPSRNQVIILCFMASRP